MNGHRLGFLLLLVAFPSLGGVLGWFAGPWLSRESYVVKLAEQLALEESSPEAAHTLQTDAFRAKQGSAQLIYGQAREMRGKFRIGGLLFGLWCGLVAGIKIVSVTTERRRREYEADRAHCVACARCYLSCPIEQRRLKERSA